MNWWKAMLWVVTNAPELYKIIKQILDMIGKLSPEDAQQAKAELKASVKATKSLRPVTDLHDSLSSRVDHRH